MGVFAQYAPGYVNAGIAVFPVDTRAKRPVVRNWQHATLAATRAWIERLGGADGLGVVMGDRTRIVEVDVDIAGDAMLSAALQRFGDTPVTIRTASGKSKLWYRHSGEGRQIRVDGDLPIDVLGSGFTIAPPSYRADLGTSYQFLTGGLPDIDHLPPIRTDAIRKRTTAAETIREGERNRVLFMWCMTVARHCDDAEALIDVAATWNAAMPMPLGRVEVERTARSAWRYESEGRNFVGLRRPQITGQDKTMDELIDEPEAYMLLQICLRWHRNRPSFVLAPRAMSNSGALPWPRRRIAHARDVLLDRGYLLEISRPDAGRGCAGRYRLKCPDPGTITSTPLPPAWAPHAQLDHAR